MAKITRSIAALTALLATTADLHPRESQYNAGNLAAANAEFAVNADGCSTVSLYQAGTYNLTNIVEGTIDGFNWIAILMRPLNQASVNPLLSITGATQGAWIGKCGPFIKVRVRTTAFTAGSCSAVLICENGIADDMLFGQNIGNAVTTIGTAGAVTTLTLPSPGAGLRSRLQSLTIGRFATAALTASATPIAISSTNLPGSYAWTFAADALALGQYQSIREEGLALSSAAQNANTVITMPATTGVIWRATATYDLMQ